MITAIESKIIAERICLPSPMDSVRTGMMFFLKQEQVRTMERINNESFVIKTLTDEEIKEKLKNIISEIEGVELLPDMNSVVDIVDGTERIAVTRGCRVSDINPVHIKNWIDKEKISRIAILSVYTYIAPDEEDPSKQTIAVIRMWIETKNI